MKVLYMPQSLIDNLTKSTGTTKGDALNAPPSKA